MDNQQIATVFEEIGNLLEVEGANHFRVLAYQNAADNIRGLGRELLDIWKENPSGLEDLPGIGHDLRQKIEEILSTGQCQYHQELVHKYGRGILDIMEIRGIGPKKVALFYKQLGIDNLEKLKAAALDHQLQKLPRMGEKSESEILKAIEDHAHYTNRMLLSEALPLAEKILEHLRKLPVIAKLEYAGSLRRRKETIGDLDFLAAPHQPQDGQKIIEHFQKFPLIKNIIASGATKCSVILENGVQADLRVVELKSFGAALHYFTGSKDHNVEIRTIAQKGNMKINEYGIFELIKTPDHQTMEKFIVGDTEENFYHAVGLSYIPPILRETRGEFQAVINGELPKIIELENLQGDLNLNTSDGFGSLSLNQIIKLYPGKKFSYLAINDTLNSEEVPSPFTLDKLKKQFQQIDLHNKKHTKPFVFKSVKLSINQDGSLELPPAEILKQIDFITIKINHAFNLSEPTQTARLLRALNFHPKVKLLSCPSARLLNQREMIALNLEKIIKACAKNHQILEINGQPDHLDLPDFQIKQAIKHSAQLSINSDLQKAEDMMNLTYGCWTAQRGWAEAKNIINTLPLEKIRKFLLS